MPAWSGQRQSQCRWDLTALCVAVSFRKRNPSPLPTFISHPFAIKASVLPVLQGQLPGIMDLSDASCLFWKKLLVLLWCWMIKEDPGAVNASAVFANLHRWAVSVHSLNYHERTTGRENAFLRIASYYILLWADNLFKEWQIVWSVWGTGLRLGSSCGCHRFPLLSICSVSKHKMNHQTTS